jgi:hypothetical protein
MRKQEAVITDAARVTAEMQLRDEQREVDYQTKEFTVELLVHKYSEGMEDDENEIFIPAYQREFVWDTKRQSKFIESVMLGLPIPYIFIASLAKDISQDEGRAEIVDGSQRIRTLHAYINDQLILTNLEKLSALNGFRFTDLELSRQRKFKRQPIRVIELSEKADEQVRRDIFERINTGSEELRAMEKRKGIFSGPFYEFIGDCAQNSLFDELCPISYVKQRREEAEEMVLRYFAYADRYENFSHSVVGFMNLYLKENQITFDRKRLKKEFQAMLEFAKEALPMGFRKSLKNRSVPRVRFEALSVGITLALRANPKLKPQPAEIDKWINSPEFQRLVVSDASNSRPRVKARIEYVRDKLLDAQ